MMYRKILGWILTFFWGIFWGAFILNNWGEMSGIKPNEWGDFLAGIFAPLAFLWLVIGYFQQGEELAQNTKALKMQAIELKASVEQQKEMVKITQEDLEVNRAHNERQYQKERISAQPLIRFSHYESEGKYDEFSEHSLHVVNRGEAISRVDLTIKSVRVKKSTESNKGIKLFTEELDCWDSGEDKNIHFQIDDSIFDQQSQEFFDIYLMFFDGLIEQSALTLYVKRNSDGSFSLSVEKYDETVPKIASIF